MKIEVKLDNVKVEQPNTSLEEQVAINTENIGNLQTKTTQIDETLLHNHNDIVDLQTRTIQNSDNIILLQQDNVLNKTNISSLTSNLTSLSNTVTTIIQDIDDLDHRVEILEQGGGSVPPEILEQINQNTQNIQIINETKIPNIEESIGENSEAIDTLENNVQQLSETIPDLENVKTNILPTQTETKSIGSNENQFLNVYSKNIYQNGNQVLDSNSTFASNKITSLTDYYIASSSSSISTSDSLNTALGKLEYKVDNISVNWTNIQNKPDFASVATSGSYDDLTDKPTIPSSIDLTNVESNIIPKLSNLDLGTQYKKWNNAYFKNVRIDSDGGGLAPLVYGSYYGAQLGYVNTCWQYSYICHDYSISIMPMKTQYHSGTCHIGTSDSQWDYIYGVALYQNGNQVLDSTSTFSSDKVTSLTDYQKASSSSAITTSDTLNQALGKLEYKVDNAGSSVDLTNVDSNIVPSTNITYDLGSVQKMFRTLYVNSLKGSHDNWWYSSGIMLDSALIPSENVEGWGKVKNCDLGDDTHYFNRVFACYNFIDYITSQQKNSQSIEYVTCIATLLPDKDDYDNIDYDLGATDRKWRNIYGTNIYQGNNKVIDSSSVGVGSTAIQNMLNTVFAS